MIKGPENPNPLVKEKRIQADMDPAAEASTAAALTSGADMLDRTRESGAATRRRRIFHGALATLMLFAAGAATDVEARHHSHDRGRARIIIEREPQRPPPPRYYVERRVVVVERPILGPVMDRLRENLQERAIIKDQATRDAVAAYRTGAREPNPPERYAAPVQQRYYANVFFAAWQQLQERTPRVDLTPVPPIPAPHPSTASPRGPEGARLEQGEAQKIRGFAEQAAQETVSGRRKYNINPEAHLTLDQMKSITTPQAREAFANHYHQRVQELHQENPAPQQQEQRPGSQRPQDPAPSRQQPEKPAGDQRPDPIIRIR